jgi:hypothetical protein
MGLLIRGLSIRFLAAYRGRRSDALDSFAPRIWRGVRRPHEGCGPHGGIGLADLDRVTVFACGSSWKLDREFRDYGVPVVRVFRGFLIDAAPF